MNGYESEELRSQHVRGLLRELKELEDALGRSDDEERKARIERHIEAVRGSLRDFGHRAKPPAQRSERRPGRPRKVEQRADEPPADDPPAED